MLKKIIKLFFLVVIIFISPKPTFADWPMPRNNSSYSGVSEHNITNQLDIKWNIPLNINNIYSTSTDQLGNIYISSQYKLTAVTSNGELKWTFNTNEDIPSSAIGSDNNIYFSKIGCNPYLYSVDQNGNKRWEYDMRQGQGLCGWNNPTALSFSPDKNTLYVGASYALSALLSFNLDGSIKWASGLGRYTSPSSAPAVSPTTGDIYLGTGGDGMLFTFSPAGTQKWSKNIGVSGPTVKVGNVAVGPDNNIYATSRGSSQEESLVSFDPNGSVRWSYKLPLNSWFGSTLAIKDNILYITEEGYTKEKLTLHAINTDSGTLIWKWISPDPSLAYYKAPIVSSNGIIFISHNKTLNAISPEGQTLWSINFDSFVNNFVISEDNLMYITLSSGRLVALTKTQPEKTPLIFIPGVGGSEFKASQDIIWSQPDGHGGTFNNLYKAGEKIWVNELEAAKPGNDDYFDVLRLKSDGITEEAYLEVIKNNIYPRAYQKAVDFFISIGYTLNQNLFLFSYDWRKDLSSTTPLLDQRISEIENETRSQKVDIVAHSMGGLVARNYIADPTKAQRVRKLITLGTPHLGATKFLKALEYGDCIAFEIGPFCLSLAPSEMKDVIQNMPGSFELAPSQQYFNFYSGNDQNHPLPYRDNRDIDNNDIIGPLTYSQTKELLTNLSHNTALFTPSEAFHKLDNILDNTNGVDTTIIAGSGSPTLGQIIEKYLFNFAGIKIPTKDILNINGDDTVPLFSASLIDPSKNISLVGPAKVYYSNQKHGNLIFDGPAMNLVKNLLTGDNQIPSGIQTQPFQINHGNQLSVHSPVNINVYDNNGNHTGPLPNGNFESNIPGSSYDTLEDAKFVWLPDDGQYTVKFEAMDKGSFDFKIREYKDNNNEKTILYKNIPLTINTKAETIFNTTSSEPPILKLDVDGDGVVDNQVNSTSILDENGSYDQAPPKTTIRLSGTEGNNGWFKSNITIEFNTDDASGSGILKTEYSLDNGETIQVYKEPFAVFQEGKTKLKFRSIDNAGNEEAPQEIELKIDKTPPAVIIDASPKTIWPPNNKLVNVKVIGDITDDFLLSKQLAVEDEYHLIEPVISDLNQVIQLEARRDGEDPDGRIYKIRATAEDLAGNKAYKEANILIPHDLRR